MALNWWNYCIILIIYLNVAQGLEFLLEPHDVVSLPSQPLWWHCQVTSTSDPVTYTWRFGEADAPTSENQIVYPNGTLYIKEVQETSEGEYLCIATSGTQTIYSKSVSLHLAALSPAFSQNPQSKTVTVKQSTTFECAIDSRPAAKISWLRNRNAVTKGTVTMVSRTLSTLRMDSVSYRDQGTYSCLATNTMLNQNVTSTGADLTVQGQPEILTIPESKSAPLGTSVLFDCVAAGRPEPTVTWFFTAVNNPEIEIKTQTEYTKLRNNSLLIKSVSSQHGGSYRCRAKNDIGEESRTALLTVTGPPVAPSFDATSGDHEAKEGEDVEFRCIARGNPPPKITWKKESGTLPVDRVTYPDASILVLKNIVSDDRGVYTCDATNTQGSISKSSTLTVLVRPSFSVAPNTIEVLVGEKATLQCQATGNPTPYIVWKSPTTDILRAGEEKSGIRVSDDGTLTIDLPDIQHHGLYTCTANNLVGSRSASAQINVRGPPVFIQPPVSQLAVEGDESVIIPCRVVGYPKPVIEWYRFRGSGEITSNSKYEVKPEGDLVIKNIMKADEGRYICNAKNGYQENRLAMLTVIVPPKFIVRPETQITEIGNTVVLNCVTKGDPVPVQSWLKNDRALVLDSSMNLIPTNNTLIITNIQEKHLGNYKCESSNQGGKITATALIYTVDGPVFTTTPTNKSVVLGNELIVVCRASSETPPTLTWYKSNTDGKKLSAIEKTDSGRVISTLSGDLTIKPSELSDEGWYICVANNNEAESVSSPIFIDVQVGPNITSTNSPQKSAVGNSATLRCEFDGDPLPVLKWRSPRNVEITEGAEGYSLSGNNLTINSVETQKDGGSWKCIACNTLTCAEAVLELLIEGPPVITDVEASRDDIAVKIKCKATGLPPPSVTYFIDFENEILDQPGHLIDGDQLSINPNDLKNTYSCKAENKYGSVFKTLTKPGKPTAPQIIKAEARQITLKWTNGQPGGFPVTKYNLEDKMNTESEWKATNFTTSTNENEYRALNLVPHSSYVFRVSISNVLATGPYSEESVRVDTLADAPSAPRNVVVKDLVGKISVTFEEPKEFNGNKNDVRYKVELKFRKPGTVEYVTMETIYRTSNQILYAEFKNVSNGDYMVIVRSENTVVNQESKAVEFRLTVGDKAPIFIPIISSAIAINHNKVEIKWTAPECNVSCLPSITGFMIILQPETGANRTNTTEYQLGVDPVTVIITDLNEHGQYTVYVAAYNDVGTGPLSVPKTVITMFAPFSPEAYTENLQTSGWLIALLAGIIAVLLLMITVIIMYIHYRRYKQQTANTPDSRFYLGQTSNTITA